MSLGPRQPRLHDAGFLAFVRTKKCCVCGGSPTEAAHIRMASEEHGKRYTGMQERPDDRWCTPLCAWCHRNGFDAQHRLGEKKFWDLFELNPFEIALRLYAEYGGDGGRAKKRTRTTIKPKLKCKIPNRTWSQQKRTFR